ncbi:putative chitin binding protein [Fusarium flagelliforme]|uniref:Putative chitin binding protein n=1 Tax=Fusarium flagelliforme TaxID=2675880 RepID=A0A395N0R1_9HYPO|nr:putative chitin binding protein [Fusarium flagelliforme]
MKTLSLLLLSALPNVVLADGFVARRQGAEFNLHVRHDDDVLDHPTRLSKRASCGKDAGSCPKGQCCSESGNCGTASAYCTSPQCQMAYSNGNCDGSKKPKGETTANTPRSTSGKAPYNIYITNCTNPGTVALTFDDGPYKYTGQVLDVLKKHNIKATFFITGNNLGKGQIDDPSTPWPKILRRMHSEGHQLASHSWSHEDLSAASYELRKQQIIYNEMAFRNVLGLFPNYIELSHNTHEQTAYNLTAFMIKTLKARGYRAVPVGECLGDARENWYVDAKGTKPEPPPYYPPPAPSGVTRDGTCGAKNGLKCKGSKWGDCCSYNNFWQVTSIELSIIEDATNIYSLSGSTSAYCDGGCQSQYGKCNKLKANDPLIVSDNGLCSEKYHQTCKGSRYGNCCSKNGNWLVPRGLSLASSSY